MKKHITLLGYSEPTIAMIFENLFSIYDHKFSLDIIQNIAIKKSQLFDIKDINYKIIQDQDWIKKDNSTFLLAVGSSNIKIKVFEYFKNKYSITENLYENTIHSSSQISQSTILGNGINIQPLVTLAPYSKIENFVTINRNASVGHHTKINIFATIAPNATIAGYCNIESGVTIGAGAVIIDGITIGENSFVGAGSLVTKNIPANVVAYGNPAKVIREINL